MPLVDATPKFCPKCHAAIVPTSAFCASCGSPIGAVAPGEAPEPSPATPVPGRPGYEPLSADLSTAESNAADRHALSNAAFAAMLGIAGFFLSILSVGITLGVAYFGTLSSHAWSLFNLTVFGLLASLGAFGLIVTLIELWLMRQAFAALAPFDTGFSTPRSLTPAAMAGTIMVIVGVLGVLAFGTGQVTGVVLVLIAVLLIGAALAIVGFFALAVGVWRMGDRFDEDLFKIGAVLLVVLGIVGMVFILIATRAARRKLGDPTPVRAAG
jgi:MFS family permease